MMREDDLPGIAAARILTVETPAEKVQLPPPPAHVDEAAMMWRPLDEVDNSHRVALAPSEDDGAASAAGIWMGVNMLHAVMVESRPRRAEDEPDDNDDTDEKPRP